LRAETPPETKTEEKSEKKPDPAEILAAAEKALETEPTKRAALADAATASAALKDYQKSLGYWKRLREVAPQNWEIREKYICACEAAGDTKQRDAEIAALRELRKSGDDPDLAKRKGFVRDVFQVDDVTVSVFEYYELIGEQPFVWRFSGKKGKEDLPFIIALETDNADTESARESGEIGKDERIYSIDQYYKDGSEGVFTMYKSKPEYAEVKKIVTDAIGHSAEPAATLEGK